MGALEPLGPWLAHSEAVDRDDYFRGIWETNVIDGTLYGVPWYVDTRLIFYRTDLLAEAGYATVPTTWAGWREAMEAVQRRAEPGQYAAFLPLNEFYAPIILGQQHGSDLLRDEDRYGDFEGPAFREAFDFYAGLFRDGLSPSIPASQMANVHQEFARGTFTFYITGPWNIGEFSRRLPDAMQDHWMTAPLPGPDGPGTSNAGGASLVMFRDAARKEAAWTLVEWLSRPERQVEFYTRAGNLPPRRAAWADSVLAGNVYADAFRKQLERVVPAPKVPEWEQIANRVMNYAESVVLGDMPVEEALAGLDRDVDRMLEKRRWVLAHTR
jgi:multiple sugar transport system substrate-binding protein